MAQDSEGNAAIERLERRVAALEGLVRQLVAPALPPRPPITAAPPPAPAAPAAPKPLAPPRPYVRDVDWEQWFGGKGLLLVGVVALLASSGFFLKYAFDRGWVAPWLRVTGGIIAGLAVAVAGERQILQGMRRFGLALVGAGGGLVYLALWAAAGPYALIARVTGTILIAGLTALVTWRAAHYDAEPLGLWALLGAFAAPVLLPAPDARPEMLLGYGALVGYATGALAHRRQWRRVFDAALVGYFILVPALIADVMPSVAGLTYLALGGLMTLRGVAGRPWPEARLCGVALAWTLLLINSNGAAPDIARVAVLGAAALLLAQWWDDRRQIAFQSVELQFEMDDRGVLFLAAPAAFCAVAARAGAGPLAQAPEMATAAAAVLYLATGWRQRWAPFVAAGFGLIAVAIAQQWGDAMVIAEWSALVLLAVLADRRLDQRGGPGVAGILAPIAALGLLARLAFDRGDAFTGPWARALYAYAVFIGGAAFAWRRRPDEPRWMRGGTMFLWALTGVVLLAGVSFQLLHFFGARAERGVGGLVAGNLALSVYWLIYAGVVVRIGFWLRRATVRTAGLGVAALAAAKIVLFDLSRLDALYRVGSFFGLALVSLGVAYAYNRVAKKADQLSE
jgi:uncharacterized membrane protein